MVDLLEDSGAPAECTDSDKKISEILDVILTEFHGDTLAFFESVRGRTEKPPPIDVLKAALARRLAKLG